MVIIFSKFLSIDTEKQLRILNAAFMEFAQKGYSYASTNEIVREAKISKGILFHYFKNKKELFLFLYDYSLETFGRDLSDKIDLMEKDIFIRWRQLAIIKIELIMKYPDLFKFILRANNETAKEVKEDLVNRNKKFIMGNLQKIMEGIDTSQFKAEIDIKKATDIMVWTIEGFTAREQQKTEHNSIEFNYDEMLVDLDSYLQLLKKCFYK